MKREKDFQVWTNLSKALQAPLLVYQFVLSKTAKMSTKMVLQKACVELENIQLNLFARSLKSWGLVCHCVWQPLEGQRVNFEEYNVGVALCRGWWSCYRICRRTVGATKRLTCFSLRPTNSSTCSPTRQNTSARRNNSSIGSVHKTVWKNHAVLIWTSQSHLGDAEVLRGKNERGQLPMMRNTSISIYQSSVPNFMPEENVQCRWASSLGCASKDHGCWCRFYDPVLWIFRVFNESVKLETSVVLWNLLGKRIRCFLGFVFWQIFFFFCLFVVIKNRAVVYRAELPRLSAAFYF